MTEINIISSICDSVATTKITQVYLNPSRANPQEEKTEEEKPIEISFKFPKVPDQIIAGIKITVGDKTIEAKIMEKEKAQDKYNDAIASGNMGVMMKETAKEFLELDVGNIMPGQTASIEITILEHL